MPVRDVVNLKAHVPHDFYIGRGSPWGNPFRIGPDGNREDVLVRYEHWIRTTRPHASAWDHDYLINATDDEAVDVESAGG